MYVKNAFVIVFCVLSSLVFTAKAKTISSTSNHTTFLELYTSEGCSSCPPAEKWLSTFTHHKTLWKDIIPINFHVTYWDYLGWKDPFSNAEFSKRQRIYNALGKSNLVATPGFVIDGRGWQGWFYNKALPVTSSPYKGNLHASINDNTIALSYDAATVDQKLVAHVALLGFDVHTKVHTGENAGRTLKHDFVVIDYLQSDMQTNGNMAFTHLKQPQVDNIATSKQAWVFWLSTQNDPTALQVAGGWL
ncbi:DUF1223 domain-containing protein [Pseudoalteromonas sp. MMG010]|uniref:DUF1223 domain-containing protein n=1 Tax=Pseudoalteromonas sp. MMG010 TaxID=2822685 RepID=UPI001B39EA7F|nr:DUF1223 domain-containing protein [Pseudoalteromonas sp. MMG010]MBQ4832065.1 DUF1223 domain-containing protein [Pseudoalteromonas sp. MMG010]